MDVADGRVLPSVRRIKVSVGDKVRLRVTADVSDEVHVNGVDKSVEVAPGQPANVGFTVDGTRLV